MKIRALQKYSRQTPRKVRTVANQVKDLDLKEALEQLALIERKAAIVIMKVMRQAVANATNNHGLKFENLELESIIVEKGSTYKRYQAVSRGRGHQILKRTCHVEVTLRTKESQEVKKETNKSKKSTKNKK